MTRSGGCLCGAVRYVAGGAALFAVICYCRDCQRASGSSGVPVLGIAKSEFTVRGQTRSHAVIGGSGLQAIRHFCATCGSLLFGTPELAADVVTLYVGSLDEPAAFAPDTAIFTRHRAPWATLAEPLTEYDGAQE